MSGAPERRPGQSPVIIEEEPPHEFYASLLGKKGAIQSHSQSLAAGEARLVRRHDSSTSLPAVIVPEEKRPKKEEIAFSRLYGRSLSDPPKLSSLALDETNRGYKILEKMGWSEQKGGLGRQRQGSMLPVKTVLKRDKKGLGSGKRKKARITHPAKSRSPENDGATQRKETKAERRRRRKQEAEQESRKAKRARMLLRTDISDEYEQLYMKLHPG